MGKFEKVKTNHIPVKKSVLLGICTVLVVLLAVMPMVAAKREAGEKSDASILSAAVETRDIDIQILGGGQLSAAGSLNIRIPEAVKLTEYLVESGDLVQKGAPIAKVDRVSVMSAIVELQETLDYLSKQISSAAVDTEADSVRAQVGGTVKAVYGQRGEAVQDVMLRDGCLAVLSLDGLMAVRVERRTALDIGDKVWVSLPDDTETEGRVVSNRDGILTVTIEDKAYDIGTKVTVRSEDDKRIGSGALYVYSQWNATAYSGTISDIQVRKNEKVATGRVMFLLEDSGNTAEFQQLVDQRRKYEELMQELFTLYQTQTLTAPCDGIVSGVEEEGAWLLCRQEQSLAARLLSFFREEQNGFTVFPVQVAEKTEDGMVLKIAPTASRVEDITRLSEMAADPAGMTQVWNFVGDTTVYTQDEMGLLQPAGDAKAGDLLLMVGSEDQMGWFVVPADPTEPKQEEPQRSFAAVLLSDGETEGEQQTQEEETLGLTEEAQTEETSAPSWYRRPGRGDRPDREDTETEDGETEEEESGGDQETGSGDNENTENDDEQTGDGDQSDSGTTETTAYYLGYIAQVTAISNGTMTVKQQNPAYAVTSLDALANVVVEAGALTTEATYTASSISADTAAVGDYLRLTVSLDGKTLQSCAKHTMSSKNETGDKDATGDGANQRGDGRASGGNQGSLAGQTHAFELYSEEKTTVASVTSQEHMTLTISIDELDITKLYVGQSAVVSVDALGGERFDATVTKISNTGENEGGNSKFTVELTLARSGEMLPGMYASATVTLETRKNVLCVPVAALEKSGTDTILYTACQEKTGILENPVVVRVGCSDGEYAEILEGVQPGQTFYYEYYDTYVETDAPGQSSFSVRQLMGRR